MKTVLTNNIYKIIILLILITLSTSSVNSQNVYTIKFAGEEAGDVSWQKAQLAKGLTVEGKGNPEIVSFRMTALVNGFEKKAYSDSSKFSRRQRDIIVGNYVSRKVLIDKIIIKKGSKVLHLPEVTFNITQRYVNKNLDLCKFAGLKSNSHITYKAIIKNPYITVDNNYGKVIKFDFSVTLPGYCISLTIKGNKANKRMLNYIRRLKRCGRFVIENIYIKKKNGIVTKANRLVYKKM